MTVYTSEPVGTPFPKLFVSSRPAARPEPSHPCEELAKAFEAATGWVLGFHESSLSPNQNSDDANAIRLGKISITDMSANWPAKKPAASRSKCDELAGTIHKLVNQLNQTKLDLQIAQSERAQMLSGSTHTNATKQSKALANLTTQLLGSAIDVAAADRAVLYLLDDQDQNLFAKSSAGFNGIEHEGLATSRKLIDAKADIEALAGAAIVMEDQEQVQAWYCPEDCQSAICIPVASSTTILGTLWLFSNLEQEYTDLQLNMVEIIAGRLAAEFQLVEFCKSDSQNEGKDPRFSTNSHSIQSVAVTNQSGLEIVSLPFEGWSAEKIDQPGSYARWFVNQDEQLVAVVGRSTQRGSLLDSTLIDAVVRSAESSCSSIQEIAESIELISGVDLNRAGFELAIAMLDPLSGEVNILRAGQNGDLAAAIPVSISANCDGMSEAVANVWSGYFGFLTQSQSLTLGGCSEFQSMSGIVLRRD